jgi:hypothetical protein
LLEKGLGILFPVFGSAALFYEFGCVALKPFLALQAAEVIGFAFISDFELSRVFVQNHPANRVSKHLLGP